MKRYDKEKWNVVLYYQNKKIKKKIVCGKKKKLLTKRAQNKNIQTNKDKTRRLTNYSNRNCADRRESTDIFFTKKTYDKMQYFTRGK